jgi:hypothetical protein
MMDIDPKFYHPKFNLSIKVNYLLDINLKSHHIINNLIIFRLLVL